MHYLYGDEYIVPSPCGFEAGELRVWIVGYCGAGQGFIGYFQRHPACKNPLCISSCRRVKGEILW